MTSKSKKGASQVGDEAQVETISNDGEPGNAGKRKKQKRRNSNRKESKKDGSAMKSIKQSIKNKFQRMKGNGRKGQQAITSNSSVASSVASAELDDLMMTFGSAKPSSQTIEARSLAPADMEKISNPPGSFEAKKPPTSKQASKSKSKKLTKTKKTKEKRDVQVPRGKELVESVQKKKRRKEKSRERRSKSMSIEPELAYKKFEMKTERIKKKKKKAPKVEPRDFAKDFRSFSDSSDYSDSASDRSNGTDGSSVYSDPGFDVISYSESGSNSASQSDFSGSTRFSHSYGSSAYSSDETDGVTMRTERSAWERNPETNRGRSPPKSRRKKRMPASGHISSPRSSPRKNSSHHIRSPRRSSRSSKRERHFFRDDEDDSEDSSYGSDTSYDSSGSDVSSRSSGSSYSGSERSHDDYYTTSYDEDPRNLRDSTFSASWTEGPISTYSSGETDFTRPREYPTLLKDISTQSMEQSQHRCESRSTAAVDSRDLGSIDENDNDEFEREQETVENIEKERADAKIVLGEEQGVMSWVFGGSTQPEAISPRKQEDVRDARDIAVPKTRLSSPPNSPQESMTIHSPQSPRSLRLPRSPRSPASSRNDFIVRDRRSAIFSDDDKYNDIGPTMSPGCSVNLDQILVGGDSMPGSYGGLKEGEFLLSNNETEHSEKQGKSQDELSVSMKGSDTFETNADDDASKISRKDAAPQEIAFSPRSPGVSSPLSRSGRPEPLLPEEADEEEESSFLYCCFSPGTGIQQGVLPSAGNVEKNFNRMAEAKSKASTFTYNDDAVSALRDDDGEPEDDVEDDEDDVDETTCASSIHTEGFQDLKDLGVASSSSRPETLPSPSEHESSGEKKLQFFTVPVNNPEENHQETEAPSFSERSQVIGSQDEQESPKRVKAESLDNYDVSEIVHGRRPYKSKTDSDGLPIPDSSASNPTGRRERRKMALKAHREFLYKSRSIDSNASFPKEGAENEDVKNKLINGDGSSSGPSLVSNSIVQEDASKTQSEGKPDALIELVRNAFNSMILPKSDGVDSLQLNNDKANGAVSSDCPKSQTDSNAQVSYGPIDDVLEVAFRFFAPPKDEPASPLIKEAQRGHKESLMVTNFNPTPSGKRVTIEEGSNSSIAASESDDSSSSEETSSSLDDDSNISDTAVVRHSRSQTTSPVVTSTKTDSHFNAEGIPLELRPKKIWRAFGSGVGTPESIVNTGVSMQTGIASLHGQKRQESRSRPRIETREFANDGSSGTRLSTSPRYRRRAEMKRLKKRQDKVVTEDSTSGQSGAPRTGLSPQNEQHGWPKQQASRSRLPLEDGREAIASHLQEPSIDNHERQSPTKSKGSARNTGHIDHEVFTSSAAHRSNNDSNISDIRARIKQRQRSKFQKQQFQQKHLSPNPTIVSTEVKQKSTRHDSSAKFVQPTTTTDRRDDSFSEFYDAIPFDDGNTSNKYGKNMEKRKSPVGNRKYHVPTTMDERDSVYPGLNNMESILSGAMSLD